MQGPKPNSASANKLAIVCRRLIYLPFFVGITWACLHSTASIFTGQFSSCRKYYIDENSLETSYLRPDHRYLSKPLDGIYANGTCKGLLPLCDLARHFLDSKRKNNIDCYRHSWNSSKSFDMMKIVPTANTIEPSNEAIVLVAPFGDTASTCDFDIALLELMEKLSSSSKTPWLAKTILLVSPTDVNQSLHDTMEMFLESYSGEYDNSLDVTDPVALPPKISDAMIRNVLVLDNRPAENPLLTRNELRILSQGRLGVLPNMDLVFVAMSVFSRSSSTGNRRRNPSETSASELFMHPYGDQKRRWDAAVKNVVQKRKLDAWWEGWAGRFGNLGLFAYTLFRGPFAPHALALERGIDAVTIQGRYRPSNGTSAREFISDYVQKLEVTIHGLANLHERLHHSTTLYLLPSPFTFVKHEEYLVPNLLLLVPVVIRAALLALSDIRRLDLQTIAWLGLITIVSTVLMDIFVVEIEETTQRNTWWSLTYAACFSMLYKKILGCTETERDPKSCIQSAQLLLCLMTIYVHVPICFGHVSLSYPSAFVWAPLVSFGSFHDVFQSMPKKVLFVSSLLLLWPPVTVLQTVFTNDCTAYVRFVYFPLHLLLSMVSFIGLYL